MTLYHGTNVSFDSIDLKKSKPNKDFGQGFYLSDNYDQAMEMAITKVEQMGTGHPVVQCYEADLRAIGSLKVMQFEDYSEAWARFVLLNRNNATPQPAHDYDIVIGPIADDRVGVQLWKYETHSIDLPTLVKNLQYIKGMTIQYFFGTEAAVRLLQRV